MASKWFKISRVTALTPAMLVTLALLFAVACGSAAPAAPETSPPDVGVAPTSAPAGAAPTAVPLPTSLPEAAEPKVNPGKVTWMIASFGNERFDSAYAADAGHDYARQMHAFYISSDLKDGMRISVPGIASKWDVSSDGRTWTFTIRKGAKFQDGTEITAEDVLWSMQHTMGPQAQEYAVASVSLSKNMDRVEQTGPDQVSMTTLAPSSALAADIAEAGGSWAGVVFPKRGTTFHNEKENDAYHRNPIGAGIMRMVKLVPAEVMTFERFDDYYHQPKNGFATDKRVKFAELDLLLVPEVATRVAALRAGDADIAPVGLDSRKQVEAGGGRVVLGQEGVAFEIRWLGCFQPQFPCHDKRVRQALNYAIDKVTMQNELYGGPEVFQIKGFGVVTPSTIGYSPELDPYPFDPDKARQLLADAGYPGGEGFGKLVINTWTSPSTPLMPESAQLAAENWKRELGLEVELRIGEEAGVKKASKLSTELYGQLLWRDNETRIDRADTFQSSYGLPPSKKKDTRHNDPELFALARETLAVFDPVERVTALNSAYQRLREEAYEIPLGYFNIPWGVGPRIQTWEPYPLAFYPSALHTITLK